MAFLAIVRPLLVLALLVQAAWAAAPEATLRWHVIEGAVTYRVQVSRDEKMGDVVLDLRLDADPNVGMQSHRFSDLKAGSYFGFVDGYSLEGVFVGRVATIPLVVGAPVTISGSRHGLAPPHPLRPRPGAQFLLKEKIHFLWSKVKEADSYRFRIVAEADPQQDLWVVEMKENALSVIDVPPSSYRYLQPGRYRWMVACLSGPSDVGGIAGDEAVTDFEVVESLSFANGTSRGGVRLRLTGAMGPYVVSSSSGVVHSESEDRGLAPGAAMDATAWLGGGWGVQLMAGLRSVPNVGGGKETRTPREAHLRAVQRRAVAVSAVDQGVELGWFRELFFGLGLREILQIDGGSTVRDPTLRGVGFGFEVQKRSSVHWGWHFRADDFIPFQVNSDVAADLAVVNFLNLGAELQWEHYFTPDAWVGVGPRAHYSKNRYDQALGRTATRNFGAELTLSLGFLF